MLSIAGNIYQRLDPSYRFETSHISTDSKPVDMQLKIHCGLLLVAILTTLRTAMQVTTEITNSFLLYFEFA